MNVSVPNYSLRNLDYVKLAVLLGDNHVLEKFGRSANTYTASAFDKVSKIIKEKPQEATKMLAKMREHMEDLASKDIHSGVTDKFTSINT